jgi:chromosome partitioning protein
MAAALDGYRVLAIDLDAQGGLTARFGGQVADEWQTVYPLLARDHARAVEAENARRAADGTPPIPLDETLRGAREARAAALVQPTRWPGIDLIGAQLNLSWAEFQIPLWRQALPGWPLRGALARALESEGVLHACDLVVIDTPPALGDLTIAGLAAADILLVPFGATLAEVDATARFFDLLYSAFAAMEDGAEAPFRWDAVRTVLTRYDPARQAEAANVVQAWLGELTLAHRQEATALLGPDLAPVLAGVYEADPRHVDRQSHAGGRESFDRTWAEVKRLVHGAWWRAARGGEPAPPRAEQEGGRDGDGPPAGDDAVSRSSRRP